MVLDIIMEQVLHTVRERMVRFNLDIPQSLSERNTRLAEHLPFGKPVNVTHESSGIETQRIRTLLELVKFLKDRNRYDNVIVLKFPYRLIVMQDDVRIKHEYLRSFRAVSPAGDISIFLNHSHQYFNMLSSYVNSSPAVHRT